MGLKNEGLVQIIRQEDSTEQREIKLCYHDEEIETEREKIK